MTAWGGFVIFRDLLFEMDFLFLFLWKVFGRIMEIRPFSAIRFDGEVVGDVGDCISPPYDVINSQQQQILYDKSDYNIVRVVRGKVNDSDNDADNVYTRAAGYFSDWLSKGVLKQDDKDAIYAYVQDFEIKGKMVQRNSFIASAKLEPFGPIVRPHEQTLAGPIVDRLKLSKVTGAKFGLVYVVYDDPKLVADKIIEKVMVSGEALIDFVDEQDVRHRLYAIDGDGDIAAIVKMMGDKSCIIADGHHRYTTGLNYAKDPANKASGYQILAFSNTCHEGLLVLATHRLLKNVEGFEAEKLIGSLKEDFRITEYKFSDDAGKADARAKSLGQMKAEQDKGGNAFSVYTGDGAFWTIVLKDVKAMDAMADGMSDAWKGLDVAILHKLILEKLFGIDEKRLAEQTNLEYMKDTPNAIDDCIAAADDGKKQAVFFMNPPIIKQIEKVADEGEKMPQKSTYFFPKIYTGLTIDKL